MKRNYLNSLALLTLENRQLGQKQGEWDISPFPLKQPLQNWRAVPWELWEGGSQALCRVLNHRNH